MKQFSFGALAGGIALAVAVPFLTDIASAQSVSSAGRDARPLATQECVRAMASAGGTSLGFFDSMNVARKAALTARIAALNAAAALTDDTARQSAVRKAGEDFRVAMQKATEEKSAAMKAAHDSVQAACGNSRGFGLMMGSGERHMTGNGQGPNIEMLATKLGITVDQLKAEMKGGKTIEQIAEDHDVDLPEFHKKQKGRGGFFGGRKGPFGGQPSAE